MAEKSFAVITAVGPDRPGVVSQMSAVIHTAGCNLEDSRMAILGGEFALIILCSGTRDGIERVEARAPDLAQKLGLGCIVKQTSAPPGTRDASVCTLSVSGVDRPGIVQAVTGLLAERGVNVASLDSRVIPAPESGTPIFELEAEVHVPSNLAVRELREALALAGERDGLEIVLE